MIKSFSHKGLRNFYGSGNKAGMIATQETRLRDVLASLDAAAVIGDMDAPGYNLHPLKGKWKGRWAVSISGPWRVTFRFENGNFQEVDYQQYH